MNSYTNGPWEVDAEEAAGGFRIVSSGSGRALAVSIQRDADRALENSGIDRETAQANARLIASAPDMREALQSAILHVEREAHPYRKWHDDVRAAIAKATGESA